MPRWVMNDPGFGSSGRVPLVRFPRLMKRGWISENLFGESPFMNLPNLVDIYYKN
jgi:hypothetical protein